VLIAHGLVIYLGEAGGSAQGAHDKCDAAGHGLVLITATRLSLTPIILGKREIQAGAPSALMRGD
jgi:hypothetical protein